MGRRTLSFHSELENKTNVIPGLDSQASWRECSRTWSSQGTSMWPSSSTWPTWQTMRARTRWGTRLTSRSTCCPWPSGQLTLSCRSTSPTTCQNVRKFSTSSTRLVKLKSYNLTMVAICRANILEGNCSGRQAWAIVCSRLTSDLDRRSCKFLCFKVGFCLTFVANCCDF